VVRVLRFDVDQASGSCTSTPASWSGSPPAPSGREHDSLFKERGAMTDDHLRQAAAGKQGQELLGTTLVRSVS